MILLETPTYGEVWLDGKLITEPDPYLHFDVIRASETYQSVLAGIKSRSSRCFGGGGGNRGHSQNQSRGSVQKA